MDGILVAPKDATTVIPMIRAANEAGIPIVIYNRPPATSPFRSTTVVADNYELAKATVRYMAERRRQSGRRHKAMVLIGDLGDINAVGRRDGFEDAVAEYPDAIEVVARVPTEWSQDKALDGVRNALYAHPDIDFVFTSSDFLFPSLVAAFKDAGKYHKMGQSGHVLLGGFDGDATAYRMLADGYLDACGVQDVYYECSASVDALLRMHRGETVESIIEDPGFVIHQGNLQEKSPQMWGAAVAPRRTVTMATAGVSRDERSFGQPGGRMATAVARGVAQPAAVPGRLPARPEMASAANFSCCCSARRCWPSWPSGRPSC